MERAVRLFRAAGDKGKTRRAIGRSQRTRAPHISHGQHGPEQLAFRFFKKFVQQISSGNMVESMQALSAIAPILVVLTPYIYGFHSQAPSRKWLRDIFKELTGEIPIALQNRKRAWFTDTLEDVNGVATTIRKMTAA